MKQNTNYNPDKREQGNDTIYNVQDLFSLWQNN